MTIEDITKVGQKMDCDNKTVPNHLHAMEKVQKLGVWIPHELIQANKNKTTLDGKSH